MEEALITQFNNLDIPSDAQEWLIDLWRLTQVIDDAADGQRSEHAERAIWAALVTMPANPFWRAKGDALIPVLAVQIIKWRAANMAEAAGEADERSFMWRAGYYDVIAAVCQLCGLHDSAVKALSMHGETLAEYREEFSW